MLDPVEQLSGMRVAILATDGFEQSELFDPMKALEEAGAEVDIISLKYGDIKAWSDGNWGKTIEVDKVVKDAHASDYDAIMLPGGVLNPDRLRIDQDTINFVKDFTSSGKPVAAICHGPQTLIETGFVKGKKMTSWPSLKTDLTNAGAKWEDSEVVVDNGLVTSRKPADIVAFNKKMIEAFAEGIHSHSLPSVEGFSSTL
jgi:protease I